MIIQKNVPLKNYTTFRIGGPARYFCVVVNREELIEAVIFAKKEKLPFFILGGGSNLLVSDKGYKGLVIKIQNINCEIKNTKVTAGAGVSLSKLLNVTANLGLSGLEWSAGIPSATIGGAIRGNAGAFGSGIKDIVYKVEVFDVSDSGFKIYGLRDCGFGYRESIFKKSHNLIIWSCELKFKRKDKEKMKENIKEILGYREERHPKFPSAGSIFKNLKDVRARDLIEKAGLKGKKIGKAKISEQHANFIINTGNATAKDVLVLVNLAKKEVKNKFGIKIEEEIQLLGKF